MSQRVTLDTFNRAETDMYLRGLVADGSFGRFHHHRELVDIDHQLVIRSNRDTLYSVGVFDLDAGPVTITLPDSGDRFMSMQIIDEDQYTPEVVYAGGRYCFDRQSIGTRYIVAAIRILVDPHAPGDLAIAHTLQDAIEVHQPRKGTFEVPDWDPASRERIHDALLVLGETSGLHRMFGTRAEVDPMHHLIGTALAWGGNPEADAVYESVVPEKNDGTTAHRLVVRDVPVDGFWSVTVYNAKGYLERNDDDAYSVNSVTAKHDGDGTITIQFGGEVDDTSINYLPITPGWNYTVRLYRPRAAILTGQWKFPKAEPIA